MGLQLIVSAPDEDAVVSRLGKFASASEVFPLPTGAFGLSIPSKALDEKAEGEVRAQLAMFSVYDLYSGEWSKA